MTNKNFYSWRAAFQKSDLPSTTKLVLFCISTYMNEFGDGAFPSVETLMVDTSLSNKSVITHIKNAADAGFLKVGKHGFSGQKWRRNEYKISYPEVEKNTEKRGEGGSPSPENVVNLTPERGEPDDHNVVKEVHSNYPVNYPKNYPTRARGNFLEEMENQTSALRVLEECLKITSLIEKKYGENRKWIRIVRKWLDSGAIPDKHIYPVIKRVMAKTKIKITSLGFFTDRILEEIDKIPQFEKDRMMWKRRVEKFKRNKFWPQSYGMEPGHVECLAPPDILEQFDFKAYRMVVPEC